MADIKCAVVKNSIYSNIVIGDLVYCLEHGPIDDLNTVWLVYRQTPHGVGNEGCKLSLPASFLEFVDKRVVEILYGE